MRKFNMYAQMHCVITCYVQNKYIWFHLRIKQFLRIQIAHDTVIAYIIEALAVEWPWVGG